MDRIRIPLLTVISVCLSGPLAGAQAPIPLQPQFCCQVNESSCTTTSADQCPGQLAPDADFCNPCTGACSGDFCCDMPDGSCSDSPTVAATCVTAGGSLMPRGMCAFNVPPPGFHCEPRDFCCQFQQGCENELPGICVASGGTPMVGRCNGFTGSCESPPP